MSSYLKQFGNKGFNRVVRGFSLDDSALSVVSNANRVPFWDNSLFDTLPAVY